MTKLLGDLKSHRAIIIKGLLFLLLGILAAVMLLAYAPDWRVGLLLVIAIWAFCRFYYFAFYVIEHYVDGQYKFAGLISFVRYLLQRGANK
ncbi:MAG: hypothetical protein JNK90_17280 [Planctomycetaceae bacterium]|nr:hypothetical protein [Planctomycetaceae bacterium]